MDVWQKQLCRRAKALQVQCSLWRLSGRRNQHDSTQENVDDSSERPATPWVRTVQSGIELLRNPKYNKGMAFTKSERDRHYLHGLLPPGYMSQDMQVKRVMSNLQECTSDLQKYIHLMALQERNERLFYRVLLENIEIILPVVYHPTVGVVCQKYGLLFRRPRGVFLSIQDRGRVMELLKNWPEKRIRVIVVTDGERTSRFGDLGVQAMGVPVGKLALYTACGGLHPAECLPVTIDVGTNNEILLQDAFYPGLRQKRVRGEQYDELVDEFMEAAKARYGEKVLIDFKDFSNENAFRLSFQYRGSHLVFNDDIQGIGAVVLAGVIGALPLSGGRVSDQTYLFHGAGKIGTEAAELFATYISKEASISIQDARQRIWMVDSEGLITKSRMESLASHKLPFAKEHTDQHDLLSSIKAIRPTVVIGISGKSKSFTKEICEALTKFSKRPVIFAISIAEEAIVTPEEVYTWTNGCCVFASSILFPPLKIDERLFRPGQANHAYIFPGLGLGCLLSGTKRIRDEMFLAAADAVASQVTDDDRAVGLIYPPLHNIREVSAHVAKAVANKAYELGIATNLPKPPDLLELARARMWESTVQVLPLKKAKQ